MILFKIEEVNKSIKCNGDLKENSNKIQREEFATQKLCKTYHV